VKVCGGLKEKAVRRIEDKERRIVAVLQDRSNAQGGSNNGDQKKVRHSWKTFAAFI
jgi:hypothetical protein